MLMTWHQVAKRIIAGPQFSKFTRSKSGSAPISRILLRHLRAMTAIPLGRTLPHASSTLPAGSAGHTSTPAYLGLLQVEIARFTLRKLPCADSSLLL